MRTAGHIFETTLDISSVLRMDMNGQKTFNSVNPNSQPPESGFAVFVIFPLAAVGLKNCCLLQCAGCQLPVVPFSYPPAPSVSKGGGLPTQDAAVHWRYGNLAVWVMYKDNFSRIDTVSK